MVFYRLIVAGVFFTALSVGAGCPPGSVEVSRTQATDGHWDIYCRKISELTQAEAVKVSPVAVSELSPEDKARLQAIIDPTTALPVLSSRITQDPEWVAYARQQQQRFNSERIKWMRLEQNLKEHDVDFTSAITENDDLTRIVLEENMATTLNLIGCVVKSMAQLEAIPPEVSAKVGVSITTATLGLNTYAGARAKDEGRKTSKVIAAFGGFKNLILSYPSLPLAPAQRQAIIQGTDALLVMVNVGQAWADGKPFDLPTLLSAGDDLAGCALNFPGLEPVKAVQDTVHNAIGTYTLIKFKEDQNELRKAYNNHLRTEDFVNDKIEQMDRWLSVYNSSLGGG